MHIKTHNNKMHIDENMKSDTNAIHSAFLFTSFASICIAFLFRNTQNKCLKMIHMNQGLLSASSRNTRVPYDDR